MTSAGVPVWVTRSALDDDESVGEDDRIDGVVGDEQAGAVEGGEVAAQLRPHRHPGRGVEGGERLVEQEQARIGGQGPGEGDALRLAARRAPAAWRSRASASSKRSSHPWARARASALLCAASPEPEGDVVERGEPREQQVVLEHEADRPLGGGHEGAGGGVVEDRAVERDATAVERLEAGDGTQRRGLAGAVGARAARRSHRRRRGGRASRSRSPSLTSTSACEHVRPRASGRGAGAARRGRRR